MAKYFFFLFLFFFSNALRAAPMCLLGADSVAVSAEAMSNYFDDVDTQQVFGSDEHMSAQRFSYIKEDAQRLRILEKNSARLGIGAAAALAAGLVGVVAGIETEEVILFGASTVFSIIGAGAGLVSLAMLPKSKELQSLLLKYNRLEPSRPLVFGRN